MKKILLSWTDVEKQTQEILRQLHLDQWRPDYVVGITRGGLTAANLISQYLGCKMYSLDVSLRDHANDLAPESNCWMAEDAFGYLPVGESDNSLFDYAVHESRILIVDDINDTGATLNWIQQDWQDSCLPNHPRWRQVWGHNVRVAVLYDNESSATQLPVSYSAVDINKAQQDVWIEFPWEFWWRHSAGAGHPQDC